MRGATQTGIRDVIENQFQSTHPLRGATGSTDQALQVIEISIHAPLAGCDLGDFLPFRAQPISIHAPLAGCDS